MLVIALVLGGMLLWSFVVLVHDSRDRRNEWKHRAAAAGTRRAPVAVRAPDPRPDAASEDPEWEYDRRFEELVDQWLGPETQHDDDPWRLSA